MITFIYNRKTGGVLAILLWILSIVFFLIILASLAIIIHLPTVLAWSFNLLVISFLLIFLCCGLYVLSRKAQWKSRLFIVLLFFSVSNTIISTVVFLKSKSIEEKSDQAKESLNKALHEINEQLQNAKKEE